MKKISLLYLIGSTALGALLTILYINYSTTNSDVPKLTLVGSNLQSTETKIETQDNNVAPYCDYSFHRLKGYKYIKPLLYGEPECESQRLSLLKNKVNDFIVNARNAGHVNYCSVFFKNMVTNEWMVINPNQGYHPGSLIKVAVMLAYLRMAESNPNILNSYVEYSKDNTVYPIAEYKSDSIILGNRYKVKDLLYFMIAHSDNRATVVLENYMDREVFMKAFSDLGLKELSFSDTSYRISPKMYSNFFSVIYNAGYVSSKSSEYAASLLTESTFKEGLVKLLPSDVKVAHKFGEWGNDYQKELHETGIVYLNENPYLITVMTDGNDWGKLSDVISQISKIVYDNMASQGRPIAMNDQQRQ